jgi:hypothetical protein
LIVTSATTIAPSHMSFFIDVSLLSAMNLVVSHPLMLEAD